MASVPTRAGDLRNLDRRRTASVASLGRITNRTDVAVIGAGAVGASIALELSKRGRDVTVLESGSDWAAGCSWGNAGLICPSHAGPWATSSDIGQAMRWMLRPDSPLGIKPSPALVPFMGRLLTAREQNVRRATELSRQMCRDSLALHEKMAGAGFDTGFHRSGLLDVYETGAGLERGRRGAEQHLAAGVRCQVLDRQSVLDLEPGLHPELAGGVFFPDEAHCDPARFVVAVGGAALAAGATLATGAEVLAMQASGRSVDLTTTAGAVRADNVIVAAGAWSATLIRALGRPVPIQGGKGYTVDLPNDDRTPLKRPLMLQESRIAVTPLDGRLRFAGTMQFAGLDQSIDQRRVASVHRAGTRMLPAWRESAVARIWSGLRPCTPDGLPLIGWLRDDMPVALATGHAMLGLTLAPVTGELVADLLDGTERKEFAMLNPGRFRRGMATPVRKTTR
jgi:D-amino-acid dehydrogenase